jgi:hypothetical protein
MGAEVLAVGRNQGHDDAKANEVNEDREEDDENGGFIHAGRLNNGRAVWGWSSSDMARVYGRVTASQARGCEACLIVGRFLSRVRTTARALGEPAVDKHFCRFSRV